MPCLVCGALLTVRTAESSTAEFCNKHKPVIYPDNNPKTVVGIKKPQVHLVPPVAVIHEAKAMENGAEKYGPYNWREHSVAATVYVSAANRHIDAWFDGEENAKDSGVHHLAHARACLGILLDAMECGKLVDDRPLPGGTAALIERLTQK